MLNIYHKNKRIYPTCLAKATQNDGWESINSATKQSDLHVVDNSIVKYGPGNYPDDDDDNVPSAPEFYQNLFMESQLNYTWIVPGILAAGPHPIFVSHQNDLSVFKKAGFKAIISVFDKGLEPKYLDDFQYCFVATSQGVVNELEAICKFIDMQESLNNPVFIHSLDGKGRAAAVLAAYLIHMEYLTGIEAIRYIRQHYDKSAITTAQEEAILQFASLN